MITWLLWSCLTTQNEWITGFDLFDNGLRPVPGGWNPGDGLLLHLPQQTGKPERGKITRGTLKIKQYQQKKSMNINENWFWMESIPQAIMLINSVFFLLNAVASIMRIYF